MERLGRHHPTIRLVRALRRDAARRRAEGLFIAEGLHLAAEALACGAPIDQALISARLAAKPEGRRLLEALDERRVPCRAVGESAFGSLHDARSPQPVLLLVRRRDPSLESVLGARAGPPLVAVVHGLQDPGNLGAVLRSADAAGATALVATGSGADLYHPRAVRASMGSLFRLPALAADVQAVLEALGRRGIRALGADPSEGPPYHDRDLRGPSAIFLGGEGAGLPRDLAARLQGRLHIPMRRGVNSLSVAAAAAVLLFEAARQRTSAAD